MHSVPFVDSHTAGEPTRVILEIPFDLGSGSLSERREIFAAKYDSYRRAFCTEPRAGDTTVGALLVPPFDPTCSAGVIFFNNAGYLNMCGHGTIGLVPDTGISGKTATRTTPNRYTGWRRWRHAAREWTALDRKRRFLPGRKRLFSAGRRFREDSRRYRLGWKLVFLD